MFAGRTELQRDLPLNSKAGLAQCSPFSLLHVRTLTHVQKNHITNQRRGGGDQSGFHKLPKRLLCLQTEPYYRCASKLNHTIFRMESVCVSVSYIFYFSWMHFSCFSSHSQLSILMKTYSPFLFLSFFPPCSLWRHQRHVLISERVCEHSCTLVRECVRVTKC